jgi:5-dehydro-2-deoxygluconokinase
VTDYDLVTLGRCSMDLFSENIGAPFAEIESFATHVGGSPTNIAVAASRLGLRTALLTAVGDDPVGDYVLATLEREGVDTSFIPRKQPARTGLALLGIEPPEEFPLVFYRENPADIYLDIDDVRSAPIDRSRALLLSGSALSRGPCRDATLFAAELALAHGVTTYLDLDLRPDQWLHAGDYGANLQAILPLMNVVIGTEEEVYAAVSGRLEDAFLDEGDGPEKPASFDAFASRLFGRYARLQALVVKRGSQGTDVYARGSAMAPQPAAIREPAFEVEILNTVGAGDAFAGGFIFGRLQGWDWRRSARMGNACGAIVVTRHGCAAAMPYMDEVRNFIGRGTSVVGGW